MSQPDDIDKLLREIEAMNAASSPPQQRPTGQPPAVTAASSPPAVPDGTTGGRAMWTAVTGVGGLVSGGAIGTVLAFLPWLSPGSTAVGAAIGAALAGFVSGPPRWFARKG